MTVKWLWRASDGAQIETVLMRYARRATVCISSQAGCAMACTFCATGQAGFERQLDAGEIVEQVLRAQHASPQRVANVVYMGMGEPLANTDAVLESLTRLHADAGISARHLTVSTVGVVKSTATSAPDPASGPASASAVASGAGPACRPTLSTTVPAWTGLPLLDG